MTSRFPSTSTITDTRRRLSLKSSEVQTEQGQPITGTPCDVPVPKNVIFNCFQWFGSMNRSWFSDFLPKTGIISCFFHSNDVGPDADFLPIQAEY